MELEIFKKVFVLTHLWQWMVSSNAIILGGLGRDYKEPCSESDPCNPIKFLECRDGTCQCISHNEIIYDQRSKSCAALAGFSCLRHIPGNRARDARSKPVIEEVETTTKPSDPSAAKYQIACVPHAKCSFPEDICECEFRYYQAPNRTCLPQHGVGERCSSDDQCDKLRFLSCINGSCSCDRSHRYDGKMSKCRVSVGSECKIINYKTVSEEVYQDDECPLDASCVPTHPDSELGVCHCNSGLKVSQDKTCGRDYGDECSLEKKCSDVHFICRNGKCVCKYPLHQYYDEVEKRCVSLVGGPCEIQSSSPETHTPCVENAACHENSPFNYCRCIPGYIENNEGRCVKAYGSLCTEDHECDPLPPLACINNACSCPDQLQEYDDKHRSCVSLAGGRCFRGPNTTVPTCTTNAYCVKSSIQLEAGRCVCARGTVATNARTCTKRT